MLVADLKIIGGKVGAAGTLKSLAVARVESMLANGNTEAEIQDYLDSLAAGAINQNGEARVEATAGAIAEYKARKGAAYAKRTISTEGYLVTGMRAVGDNITITLKSPTEESITTSFNKSYWADAKGSLKQLKEAINMDVLPTIYVKAVFEQRIGGVTVYKTGDKYYFHNTTSAVFSNLIDEICSGVEWTRANKLHVARTEKLSHANVDVEAAKVSSSLRSVEMQSKLDALTGETGLNLKQSAEFLGMTIPEVMELVKGVE